MSKKNIPERSGDILDYITWRGDIPIAFDPWNEVDSLIIATAAYANFGENELRFGSGRDLTIQNFLEAGLLSKYPQEEMLYAEGKIRILLEDMAQSRRFQNIRLLDQVNDVDTGRNIQFSAVTFEIPDVGIIIGYRGTDSSLVGWKEDFMMGYESPVPAQTSAVRYLKTVAEITSGSLYLSGHSKGGNLALYSAAHAEPEIQARLKSVCSFDGPGLDDDTISSEGYMRIRELVNAVVPSDSIIGLLLNYHPNYRVVGSTATSIKQHVPFSWKVSRNRFLLSDTVSRNSQVLDQSIHEWLKTCSPEQREILVTTLFTLLEKAQNSRHPEKEPVSEELDEVSTQKMLAILYRLMTIYAGNTVGEKIRRPLAMAVGELNLKSKSRHALFIRSDQIDIDNRGHGFRRVMEETEKIAEFTGLNHKDAIHLQLLAEEMLGTIRSVTGEWNASFRTLCDGNQFKLLLTTRTLMDNSKRALLTLPPEGEKTDPDSFREALRYQLEQALLSDTDAEYEILSAGSRLNTPGNGIAAERWIRFNQSVLYRLADSIQIAVHGGLVFVTVSKAFAATNMKTAVIEIDSRGNGFTNALEETARMAERNGLTREDSLHLQLFTEEMLNMIRTVAGGTKASFWIERDGSRYDLLITTKTLMDRKKRELLLASGKKDTGKGFLGRLRGAFVQAMASGAHNPRRLTFDKARALQGNEPAEDWDRYEQSVLLHFADDVKIAIHGNEVKMTVSKVF